MHIELSIPLLLAFLLVLARVSGIFVVTPIPQFRGAPVTVRLVPAFALSVLLAPVWTGHQVPPGTSLAGWVLFGVMGGELLFGISVGLVLSLLVETFNLAAQFLGLQAGYGYASTIDPASEADSGVLLVLTQLGAWMLFAALGLEVYVLRALAASFERFPPGSFWVTDDARAAVLDLGRTVVAAAFRLALPVIGLLILVDLAFAAFGKLHAQLQLLTLVFPVKMLAALILLAAVFDTWRRVFEAVAGQAMGVLARMVGG